MQHPWVLRKYLLNHRSGHTGQLLSYFSKFISQNTILSQIILFLSKTVLILSYILSVKLKYIFSYKLST
jgi:hypothetical protein